MNGLKRRRVCREPRDYAPAGHSGESRTRSRQEPNRIKGLTAGWWTTWDLNPQPPHCERGALPIELVAHCQMQL